jgi:hypothetical protein
VDVVKVAPEGVTGWVASNVAPLKRLTLPPATCFDVTCEVVVATIVTSWPENAGFGVTVRLVEVGSVLMTSVSDAELARRLLDIAKLAVTG